MTNIVRLKPAFVIAVSIYMNILIFHSARASSQTLYTAEEGAITRRNGQWFHNRPLYIANTNAFVLAGDRPHFRFARDPYVYGCVMLAYIRGETAVWIHDFKTVRSVYRSGVMYWILHDERLKGLELDITAVPGNDVIGFSLKVDIKGAKPDDQFIWAFGGSVPRSSFPASLPNISWALDPIGNSSLLSRGFVAEDCKDNHLELSDGHFYLALPAYTAGTSTIIVTGRCSVPSNIVLRDAAKWKEPFELLESEAFDKPIAVGTSQIPPGDSAVFLSFEAFSIGTTDAKPKLKEPEQAFAKAYQYAETISKRVTVTTPDAMLNAAVSAASHAIDGVWYPPVFVHGGLLWNVPYPGWRTLYGPTAMGWIERVKEQAKYYISHQETDNTRRKAISDAKLGHAQQSQDSRFYGRGRIRQDSGFYNFQTQFFDMLIHAWRWSGDRELEHLLRPALELQIEWARECFDPDDDGLYESYINTWPTDSVWYNGGGSVEESAYAFTANLAAAAMQDNPIKRSRYIRQADKIKRAMLEKLWANKRGHFGSYIEQGGLKRLHTDAWLYSIFLPIDAGMLPLEKAASSLYYTEYGLQRETMPHGGQRCWTSNWVPSVWSSREMFPGDNYHLALAYFQTGLPEEAWDLLRGTLVEIAYNSAVPGNLGALNGGTDFNDCSSMFARTVVEGLFGFKPDYPRGRVMLTPGFPADWKQAFMKTPDFSIRFQRKEGEDRYNFVLTKKANMNIRLPALFERVIGVELNGRPVEYDLVAGLGRRYISLQISADNRADIVVRWKGELPPFQPINIQTKVNTPLTLKIPKGSITEIKDVSGLFAVSQKGIQGKADSFWSINRNEMNAVTSSEQGHFLVLVKGKLQQGEYWQQFKIYCDDPKTNQLKTAKTTVNIPSNPDWSVLDISEYFNGDIRQIYKQKYLSPRPDTCSLRIGDDGYSPWTFYHWGYKPPKIDLNNVPGMLNDKGHLLTNRKIPFHWQTNAKNIAFTSLWDNWPDKVELKVEKSARAAFFLVCGSTNQMQTRIANARLTLNYADKSSEVIELIPPDNFWTLCPLGGADYNYQRDAFALPKTAPVTVQLGGNCRAVLLAWNLKPEVLETVSLEALSQEVVIGLMGITLLN